MTDIGVSVPQILQEPTLTEQISTQATTAPNAVCKGGSGAEASFAIFSRLYKPPSTAFFVSDVPRVAVAGGAALSLETAVD